MDSDADADAAAGVPSLLAGLAVTLGGASTVGVQGLADDELARLGAYALAAGHADPDAPIALEEDDHHDGDGLLSDADGDAEEDPVAVRPASAVGLTGSGGLASDSRRRTASSTGSGLAASARSSRGGP